MREEGYYWVSFGYADHRQVEIARWQATPFPAWWFAEEGDRMYPADEKFGASIEVVSERLTPPVK